MFDRPDGTVLVTSGGLFRFRDNKLSEFAPAASEFIRSHSLTCVTELADERLVIGTFRGGIIFVKPDGEIQRVLDQNSALPTSSIYSLYIDRDGGLWATSGSHIVRISLNSGVSYFGETKGVPAQPVVGIGEYNGHIAITTDEGLSDFVDDDHFRLNAQIRGPIHDFHAYDKGVVVARGAVVDYFSGNTKRQVYHSQNDIFTVRQSAEKTFLMSDGHSVVQVTDGGSVRSLTNPLPDLPFSFARDQSGNLWIGTYGKGLLRAHLDPNGPVDGTPTSEAEGLPDMQGQAFAVGNMDGSVAAFFSSGAYVLKPNATKFSAVSNYPARYVSGADYLGTDRSIWTIHPPTLHEPAAIGQIDLSKSPAQYIPHYVEGLWRIGAPHSILAERDGNGRTTLWIGGANGLLRAEVVPGHKAPPPRPPLLHAFARTEKDGALEPITGPLPYSTQSVLFEFAAPEFARRPALRLETFVGGIDRDWMPADATARREFTALRDGHYSFQVRVVAETGVVSEVTAIPFNVLPPWWRTWPALVAGLLLLVPLGYSAYWLRLRSLRRHNASLEEKVRQRTEQLEQANAAKTDFVANMSHDIRNPLNGIVGLALALESTPLNPRQREIVATLRECTGYLSSLVDDVLDFASIEAGRLELKPAPYGADELLRSVATTLRAESAERGATLTVTVDPELPATLMGDAGRIQQILVNFASNALKYGGSSVGLEARLLLDAADEMEFAVTDDGAGLTEAETNLLFTKFTRLPQAREGKVAGTGLGLAACKHLADLMGASVGVESQPGQGSRFYLRLPCIRTEAPAEIPAMPILPTASVLLVEDTDYNAWAATAVLEKLGLACDRARNGTEAIELYKKRRYDIVLLDRNLPDMDGTAVARTLRELESDGRHRATLFAVTAYCTADDRKLCLDAGMDAFVGKPLTPDKLRKALAVVGQAGLSAASVHVSPNSQASTALNVSLLSYVSDGTPEGLNAQIERFLAMLAKARAELDFAAGENDFGAIGDAAHRVLSHARMIESASLAEASTALERAAREGHAPELPALVARVHREIQAITATLARHHSAGYSA